MLYFVLGDFEASNNSQMKLMWEIQEDEIINENN